MSEAEKRWILQNRSGEAKHWNIISDLTAENLRDFHSLGANGVFAVKSRFVIESFMEITCGVN